MERGVWWATVHGVAKESDTTERQHIHMLNIKIIQTIEIMRLQKRKQQNKPGIFQEDMEVSGWKAVS